MKENKIVPVTTESLKEELNQFSKETLIDMVDMWIQNYWVCQSYWVTYVERDFGYDAATRLDGEVFKKSIEIQARRLKALLGLKGQVLVIGLVELLRNEEFLNRYRLR